MLKNNVAEIPASSRPAASGEWQRYRVTELVDESDIVRSFVLEALEGKVLVPHRAGQFLTIKKPRPDGGDMAARSYTISDGSNGKSYRISVKREPQGEISSWLHSSVTVGDFIEAQAPEGDFVLKTPSHRPVVLLSGGIGITPMIAMLNELLSSSKNHRAPIYFIHSSRDSKSQAFRQHLNSLRSSHSNLTVHVRYSGPLSTDVKGSTHDSEGLVDVELLQQLLPINDYDFYLCGPAGFMQAQYDGLLSLGVSDNKIFYESFGPASVKRSRSSQPTIHTEGTLVSFSRSRKVARHSEASQNILELAEQQDLKPKVGCRIGACGACLTKIISGSVTYMSSPKFTHDQSSEALICCARPGPDGVDLDV